jgi:hypothetical protein
VVRSYSKVFDEEGYEEEDVDDQAMMMTADDEMALLITKPAEVDVSIGGYVAGTGEM